MFKNRNIFDENFQKAWERLGKYDYEEGKSAQEAVSFLLDVRDIFLKVNECQIKEYEKALKDIAEMEYTKDYHTSELMRLRAREALNI